MSRYAEEGCREVGLDLKSAQSIGPHHSIACPWYRALPAVSQKCDHGLAETTLTGLVTALGKLEQRWKDGKSATDMFYAGELADVLRKYGVEAKP